MLALRRAILCCLSLCACTAPRQPALKLDAANPATSIKTLCEVVVQRPGLLELGKRLGEIADQDKDNVEVNLNSAGFSRLKLFHHPAAQETHSWDLMIIIEVSAGHEFPISVLQEALGEKRDLPPMPDNFSTTSVIFPWKAQTVDSTCDVIAEVEFALPVQPSARVVGLTLRGEERH